MKVNPSKETNDESVSLKTLRNRRKRLRKKKRSKLNGCNLSASVLHKAVNKKSVVNEQWDSLTSPVKGGKPSMISLQTKRKCFSDPQVTTIDDESKKGTFEAMPVTTEVFAKKQKLKNSLEFKNVGALKTVKRYTNIRKPSLTNEEKQKLRDHRRNLPVFNARNEIIQIVRTEPCSIFIGDTACGKSTQIPQYLLEGGVLRNKLVAVTQPRRVAAITIAERVSDEMGTVLGQRVGYSVRFEDVTSSLTRIKFVTDGMLLRESITDPSLLSYNAVVLDEAHERTLHTDVLFGVVKKAQLMRKVKNEETLKIVIMSATMNYDHFSKFFYDAPVYRLRGREYRITILNTLKTQEDYVFSALVTVLKIHKENDNGDILVFCTGAEEIQSMVAQVLKASIELEKIGYSKLLPLALYAALPSKQQKQAFLPVPEDTRKVIFSTNIAETSVTIPGVKYVIDTGMVKTRTFNAASGFDLLKVMKISKAQAEQRTGRAGREFEGYCYRLYTEEEYQNLTDFSIPEIQRCSLTGAILQIVALGIQNIKEFEFLDRPSEENINSAIEELVLLGALKDDSTSEMCQLTENGKMMVNFPLDPKLSKIIIESKKFKCTDEVLTIISLLSTQSLLIPPPNEKESFLKVWKKFSSYEGDHIMLLRIYKAFKTSRNSAEWCQQNFVNLKSMRNALAIRKQLSRLCLRADIRPCSCGPDTSLVRRCLTFGLFMNSAQLYDNKDYKTFANNHKIHLHPSSCLFTSKPEYCIYSELVETSKCYMRTMSVVEEEWLKAAAPSYFENKRFMGYKLQIINH